MPHLRGWYLDGADVEGLTPTLEEEYSMGQKFSSAAMDRRSRFPEGRYVGEISELKGDTNEDGTASSVVFRLVKNTAVEADREPGGRICFVRIPTHLEVKDKKGKIKTIMTSDIEDEDVENEDFPFMLRIAVGTFLMLGIQLGAATLDDAGEVEWDDTLESFIDDLREGEYEGAEIEFIVAHRQYVSKRGANKGNVVKVADITFPTELREEEEATPEPEPEKAEPRVRKGKRARAKVVEDEPEDDEPEKESEPEPEEKPARGSGKPKFVRRSRKASAE